MLEESIWKKLHGVTQLLTSIQLSMMNTSSYEVAD